MSGATRIHPEMGFDQARPPEPKSSPPLRRILIIADLIAVAIGWSFALLFALSAGQITFGLVTILAQTVLIMSAGAILLSASGLYRRQVSAIRSVEVARIGRVSLALGVLSVVTLASIGRSEAQMAGAIGGASWFLLLALERGVLREWIAARRASGDFRASVLVVGGGADSTMETARFLADHPVLGFRVVGVACPELSQLDSSSLRWFGGSDDVLEQVARSGATGVVLDSSSLTGEDLNEVVKRLSSTGVHVHISSGLRGVDVRRISVSPMADEAFLHVAPLGLSRRQELVKRMIDLVGATAALLLLSPVLAISAVLVWAQDRGPVLFRQERVGKDGRLFELYKLRSMVLGAERLQEDLDVENERAGPLFKLERDPRITRVGGFLRSSSIDEIPQLFNVLQGHMSLVGPRPALPEEVAQFDDQLNTRLTVNPGVTGLWQVEARDLSSFDLYRRYDLLYVQNWSVGLDLAIIARTIVVVALRAGRSVLPSRSRGSELTIQ